jgi:hypothetical protein
MESAEAMTTKRFLRVLAGGVISGGLYAGIGALQTTPLGVFIVPLQAALINALAKWLREKYKINLPL